jgi:hypothetical protein
MHTYIRPLGVEPRGLPDHHGSFAHQACPSNAWPRGTRGLPGLCHIHARAIVGNGSKRPHTPCARATRNARGLDRTSVRQVMYAESDTVEL